MGRSSSTVYLGHLDHIFAVPLGSLMHHDVRPSMPLTIHGNAVACLPGLKSKAETCLS